MATSIGLLCLKDHAYLFKPIFANAIACGPDFPLQLTQDRQSNLSYLPQTSLASSLPPSQNLCLGSIKMRQPRRNICGMKCIAVICHKLALFENSELSEAHFNLSEHAKGCDRSNRGRTNGCEVGWDLPQALTGTP